MDKVLIYSASLAKALEAKYGSDPKFGVHVTCASCFTDKTASSYFRYVALTQRVVYDGDVICYVTYRLKFPKISAEEPRFSSFEIFSQSFDRSDSKKFHIDDPSFGSTERDQELGCRKAVFAEICSRVDSSK